MRGKSGIVRDLGVLSAAQVAAQILNVVALIYVARRVGPHWFGVLQIGAAVSAYALITAEWGMFSSGIRAVSRLDRPADVLAYARRHLGLLAALAFGALAAGGLALPLLPFFAEDRWVFVLYLLAVVPQIWMLDWVGVGLERMPWVGAAKASRSLVYAFAVLLLLSPLDGALGWPAHRWVPVMFLASLVVGDVVIGAPVTRWLGGTIWPAYGGRADWRARLVVAGPIGAGIVIMRLLLNLDVVLLGVLAAPEIVGSYAAAAKLAFVLVIAVEVLWSAMLPRLSRLWREAPERFRSRFVLYLGLILAVFVPAGVGGLVVGEPLMRALYGAQFPAAGGVFRVLSVSYVLLSTGQFFGNALIACDRQRDTFPPVLASAAVALGAALWLVPRAGAAGAAWAMLSAHASLLMLMAGAGRTLLTRRLFEALGIVVVAAAAMGLAVWGVTGSWPLTARIGAGAASYALLVFWPLRRWLRQARSDQT